MQKGYDFIGVGVGAAIIQNGKIFITKRGRKAKNERGKWEIPGGGVEFNETFEKAVKREIKEEHGIDLEIIELLGVCSHIIPKEKQHWVSPTYVCRIKKGTPRIVEIDKCDEIGWFTLDEAKKLDLSIVTKYDIELLSKKFLQGLPKY